MSNAIKMPKLRDALRFMRRITINAVTGCWNWSGSLDSGGYGNFRFLGRLILSHRFAYLLFNGHLPNSDITHTCDNPACVNPHHLAPGTERDNTRDCFRRQRHSNAKVTPQQIRDIKALASQGFAQFQVAKQFGIDPSAVSRIVNGKRWGWLEVSNV